MIELTEDDIIKYVMVNAKYLPMGRSEYHVHYNGILFYANDTRCLVIQICKKYNIPYREDNKKRAEHKCKKYGRL